MDSCKLRCIWNSKQKSKNIHFNSLLSNVCKQLLPETESNMNQSYISKLNVSIYT